MSKNEGTVKKAIGIGAAVAAISGGMIFLGRKIYNHFHKEDEGNNETEDETEIEEDTEEESEEEE